MMSLGTPISGHLPLLRSDRIPVGAQQGAVILRANLASEAQINYLSYVLTKTELQTVTVELEQALTGASTEATDRVHRA
ncbi:hypothetical protein [Candidatus Vallotia cooleyia]|uniref:hypothetical protein n=1 Tax=Candidatus Vallotiella adelgis TaxID=1177211 RepID=UPI001D01151C|nr:hypothetical protein [Candidatus Vallotia cooleyia]UDG81831.1 hypothetical protein GJV44_00032 [Candidatus Vallotia cooleyia]